jgi:hypothetical protein
VEAVARELVGRGIIPGVAGLRALGEQVTDHVAKLLLRSDDLHASMQERRELGAMVPVGLVGDQG